MREGRREKREEKSEERRSEGKGAGLRERGTESRKEVMREDVEWNWNES